LGAFLGFVFEDKDKRWQLALFGIIAYAIFGAFISVFEDNLTIVEIAFSGVIAYAIFGAFLGSVFEDRNKIWQLALLGATSIPTSFAIGKVISIVYDYNISFVIGIGMLGAFLGFGIYYAHDMLRNLAALSRVGAARCYLRLGDRERAASILREIPKTNKAILSEIDVVRLIIQGELSNAMEKVKEAKIRSMPSYLREEFLRSLTLTENLK
ncbi:MAG: hypothetical protein ACE5KT_03985, partial [Methanosarcinales archaeon]